MLTDFPIGPRCAGPTHHRRVSTRRRDFYLHFKYLAVPSALDQLIRRNFARWRANATVGFQSFWGLPHDQATNRIYGTIPLVKRTYPHLREAAHRWRGRLEGSGARRVSIRAKRALDSGATDSGCGDGKR